MQPNHKARVLRPALPKATVVHQHLSCGVYAAGQGGPAVIHCKGRWRRGTIEPRRRSCHSLSLREPHGADLVFLCPPMTYERLGVTCNQRTPQSVRFALFRAAQWLHICRPPAPAARLATAHPAGLPGVCRRPLWVSRGLFPFSWFLAPPVPRDSRRSSSASTLSANPLRSARPWNQPPVLGKAGPRRLTPTTRPNGGSEFRFGPASCHGGWERRRSRSFELPV